MATLCDIANRLVDLLCGTGDPLAGGIVQLTAGVTAKVSTEVRDDLKPKLDSADAEIATIRNASEEPSLSPVDAGEPCTVDTSGTSTEDLGEDACEEAKAFRDEVCRASADHDLAGGYLCKLGKYLAAIRAQADPT